MFFPFLAVCHRRVGPSYFPAGLPSPPPPHQPGACPPTAVAVHSQAVALAAAVHTAHCRVYVGNVVFEVEEPEIRQVVSPHDCCESQCPIDVGNASMLGGPLGCHKMTICSWPPPPPRGCTASAQCHAAETTTCHDKCGVQIWKTRPSSGPKTHMGGKHFGVFAFGFCFRGPL